MVPVPLIRLKCGTNSYEWGKPGKDSAVAKYAAATPSDDFSVQENEPYSELWMGTHSKLPSTDLETGRTLLDMVQDNKALMSTEVSERFGDKLPFLLKVLSINKALSIQAHPNKKLAEKLHNEDPEHYPDDNHKPEMIIAITSFEGLCGFRPLQEILHFLKTTSPLRKLVGAQAADTFESAVGGKETSSDKDQSQRNHEALKQVFSSLMKKEGKDEVTSVAKELVEEAKTKGFSFAGSGGPSSDEESGKELANLVVRLNSQFPDDIGLFVLFFLNHVKLQPGEAMFLCADDVHAYLAGDAIECMAASDNVVRAGFTPKFKDINTLTNMLTYSYAPISEQKMTPTPYPHVKFNTVAYMAGDDRCYCNLYQPPTIDEFRVLKTDLVGAGAKATFAGLSGPSIVICTRGKGKIAVGPKKEEFNEGYVFFVGAGAECVLECTEGVSNGASAAANEGDAGVFTTFRAFCEA